MLNLYILVFNNNYLLKTKSRFILISKEIPGIKKERKQQEHNFSGNNRCRSTDCHNKGFVRRFYRLKTADRREKCSGKPQFITITYYNPDHE